MANTQQIQRRIKSVKNTKQITKAMELVSASKMRKSQEATLSSRPYSNAAQQILQKIASLMDVSEHELYQVRDVKNRLHIVISSDRGLAGAYNSNILKGLTTALRTDKEHSIASHVLIIGRSAGRFVSRIEDINILGVYDGMPEKPSEADVQPLIETALSMFQQATVDEVLVHFTDYKSSITQEASLKTLLPAIFVSDNVDKQDIDPSLFEPSPQAVLNTITPRLVEAQFMQMLLESFASEHSMRMMAMKNASDNAEDLVDDLTLVYNGARQAAITQELAEITGGAEAIA